MTQHLFYLVTDAVMRATAPAAGYQAQTCPDVLSLWLVGVSDWYSVSEQDIWERLPGVTCLHPEDHGQPAPVALIAALASLGARPGQSRRDVLTLARRWWPVYRL